MSFTRGLLLSIAALPLLAFVCHAAIGASLDDERATSHVISVDARGDDTASIPDFDGDGTIGFGDFVKFAAKFGLVQGDDGYDAQYDLNGNDEIGFGDFVIFAQNFGREVSSLVSIPDSNLRAAIEAALGKNTGAPITRAELNSLDALTAPGWEWPGISDLTGLESATNLTFLHLSHQQLTDVSALSGLTKLTELHLGFNRIRDLSALRNLADLKKLYLRGNRRVDLSTLAGSGLARLEILWLGINNLTDVSALGNLASLTELELDHNNLADISALSGLTNLRIMRLDDNDLTDVSALGRLNKLETLRIGFNRITDVSALGDLPDLTELDLRANNLVDVSALGVLTRLTDLNLAFNNITDVATLSGLTRLTELDLRGNPLNASSINQQIPSHKRNGATVHFDSFRKGDFDIELVFLDGFTEGQKNVIRYATRRWMSIITEDLPDYEFSEGWSDGCGDQSFDIASGERIDDLRIYAVSHEEGPLGWAGSSVLRETHQSVVGCMSFNMQSPDLLNVALHEIGHVLGFGLVWDDLGFYQNPPDGDEHFNGPHAIAAFDEAGGRNYPGAKVPLADPGHWSYSVLAGELMAPSAIGGALSAITIQSLADLGYGIDVTQADPYTLPGANAGAKIAMSASAGLGFDANTLGPDILTQSGAEQSWDATANFNLTGERQMPPLGLPSLLAPELTCGAGLMNDPVYVVDQQGRIVRTISR
ncbi:MAG: leucine-rich repeat domain-containing protein [Gemmatimonadota bacterium]|nr:leucine-rich repeat domain-containing protein [Gemmatimonadota bacterium]